MASSSSSTSTTVGSSTYDVFLNFRGEDTRNTFTSFLYRTLKRKGINVFIDSKNLWTGESIGPTLLKAIQGSKISIPIFSEHYADSKWCLIELAQIIECHKFNGQLIIPIFFHVDPSDVRNQKKGNFAEAFQEHEKKFESHIVKGWRDALKEVGNLKGEVVHSKTDQAELVDLVVERITGVLNSNTHLPGCKYTIGIDSTVNDLLSMLDFGSTDVHFVGIWGLGGIGKTTIAKIVYNRIISNFNKHSFISDIREHATSSMGLVSLQKRLLKDVEIDIDIPDYHRGKRLIEERLCKEKVFVVLDDVESKEQLNALAGGTNWFGQGSRVIITTRDHEILSNANVDEDKICRPLELNDDQSLQLFSLHAFSRDLPPDGYMQLSKDVASYSGGLPLTLEVLGSLLLNKRSIEEWESILQYVKEIPHEEVQRKLKISYDKLDHYQKEIFLDAACHFIGWEKEEITSLWEACGYHPRCAIPILVNRSLIKFEMDDEGNMILKMHDQIRDMGRGIVLGENYEDPTKRSRVWSRDDIMQVLESNKGTNMVKGLVLLDHDLSDVYFNQQRFDMMSNLKFLDISVSNVENFCSLSSKLRWFRWIRCPWKFIPANFYHKDLVHLELSGTSIQQAWNIGPPDEKKRFQKLKVLDLRCCDNLSKSPNFSWFPYLEQLVFSWCQSLENLDESIGQLSQLRSLDLAFCYKIMELPNSIGNLKSLVKLNLKCTGIKELPDNICKLSSLKNLELSGCSSLKKLPEFIGDLKNLVELDLENDSDSVAESDDGFEGMQEVPESVGLLENLEVLNASGWRGLVKLPRSMGKMRRLHTPLI